MSTSFTLWRAPSWFIEAMDRFGEPAFDAFFESGWLDEDESWNEAKIQELLDSEEEFRSLYLLGELLIPILREGH